MNGVPENGWRCCDSWRKGYNPLRFLDWQVLRRRTPRGAREIAEWVVEVAWCLWEEDLESGSQEELGPS